MTIYPATQNVLMFIGRILFSLMFVIAGLEKIMSFNQSAQYIASAGLPFPSILVVIAIIFELLGGLMILLGWRARIGALLILIFTSVVTFAIHHFWTYSEPQLTMQAQHFFKNLAIIGACLYIISFGAGSYSLDYLRLRKRPDVS